MSTEATPPKGVNLVQSFAILTDKRPLEYSTRVCSAALMSALLVWMVGRTSTTVSARSPAMILTSATLKSSVAEIGWGVSNTDMATAPNRCTAAPSTGCDRDHEHPAPGQRLPLAPTRH